MSDTRTNEQITETALQDWMDGTPGRGSEAAAVISALAAAGRLVDGDES